MNIKDYEQISSKNKLQTLLKDQSKDLLDLLKISENQNSISLYIFDYEYNDFFYFCGDKKEQEHEYIIKEDDFIYASIKSNTKLSSNDLSLNIIQKLRLNIKKLKEIKKDINEDSISFNINLFYDENLEVFAKNLKGGLEGIFNTQVIYDTNIKNHINSLKDKQNKHIIIYLIDNEKNIKENEAFLASLNELIIVIGPNNHKLSMYCGKLGIENYIPITEFRADEVKKIVLNTRNKLLNKNKYGNKILGLCGISGGVGVTTIAMNMAELLSKKLYDKNILYIDLSSTKAVSNLFLEQNPMPEKTIIDLINLNEFHLENNLSNGLIKRKENFYCITGIQKHIDKEFLEQDVFIENLLSYINDASDYFNYIIIDLGQADASNLKSTLYELVNDLWLITEMNLPHVSKLKTFYSLMKRAGLKEKISFIVNRYDSQNALSLNDVSSILNMSEGDKFHFEDFKIPNDYQNLGRCWNYCELLANINDKSPFIKKLELILEKKSFYSEDKKDVKSSWLNSLFKKSKK